MKITKDQKKEAEVKLGFISEKNGGFIPIGGHNGLSEEVSRIMRETGMSLSDLEEIQQKWATLPQFRNGNK